MKATGIVRKLDNLGRVVIPMEVRRTLNIDNNDPLEIFIDNGGFIMLRKYEVSCVFCNDTNASVEYKGKIICKKCKSALDNLGE